MSEIYLADRECKVNASEALKEIDKQYLGWGWNTEQTTLDLVDYAIDLESQLEEARAKLIKIESVCDGYKAMQSEYETGTEIPYCDIMNIIKEKGGE